MRRRAASSPPAFRYCRVRRAADKLKYLAGTESGMGVWINDVVPEQAAQRLRQAGQRKATS